MKWHTCALIAGLIFLFSCKNNAHSDAAKGKDSAAAALQSNILSHAPAVFLDTLPCADCEGIVTKVFLDADSTFIMEQSFLGVKDTNQHVFYDLGKWNIKDSIIQISSTSNQPMSFKYVSENVLELLDNSGKAFPDTLKPKYTFSKIGKVFTPQQPILINGVISRSESGYQLNICAVDKTYEVQFASGKEQKQLSDLWAHLADTTVQQAKLQGEIKFSADIHHVLTISKILHLADGKNCD